MSIKLNVYIYALGLLVLASQVSAQADTVFSCSGINTVIEAEVGFDRYRWFPFIDLQSSVVRRAVYEGTSNTTLFVQQQSFIGDNLITNPDFQDGNVDFTSGYSHAPGGSSAPETYSLVTSADQHNPSFAACTDVMGPTGLIMAVDGGANIGTAVWCQTIPINPNASYGFRVELASLSVGNPARLRVRINGEDVGSVLTGAPQECIWNRFLTYWNATGTATAEVCIYNLNTSSSGNDFAIDRLAFFELSPVILDSFYVSIGQQTFGTTDIKLCENERFTDFGLNLGIGDSGEATLQNAVGCDSILTITGIQGDSLIVNKISDTLCLGDTLRFENWVITTDTLLCKTLPSLAGCDTILCLEARYFSTDNIEATITSPSCAGDINGEIELTNLAGSGNIQYSWSDGPTGAIRQGLAPGTFTYIATDQKGCMASESIVLDNPIPLVIEDILTVGVRCATEQNGFAIIDVNGGTGPIEFIVEQNGNNFNIDTLGTGTFNLTVRDSLGCTIFDNFQIEGPGPIDVTLRGDTLVRLGELANHQVSFFGDNPTFSLTYNGIPVDSLLDMGRLNWAPPGEGLLVAMVIDENGCEASQSIFVKLQSRDTEFFPSAFSPNEDGVNDRFGPALDPAIIAFEEFMVADRWGNIIYRVQDCPIDPAGTCYWDGKRKDEILDTGVYIYYAVLLLVDGTTITQSGDVTLMTTRD